MRTHFHVATFSEVHSSAAMIIKSSSGTLRIYLLRPTRPSPISASFIKVENTTGRLFCLWSVPKTCGSPSSDDVEMSFHPSKELIATASRDHKVRVCDFGKDDHLEGHEADVISVVWSKDVILISSSDDGTVRS